MILYFAFIDTSCAQPFSNPPDTPASLTMEPVLCENNRAHTQDKTFIHTYARTLIQHNFVQGERIQEQCIKIDQYQ